MNAKLVYLGLLAFVVGLVLLMNIGYIIPNFSFYAQGAQLAISMLFEFIMIMSTLGGIILMFVGSDVKVSSHHSITIIIAAIMVVLVLLFLLFSLGTF